MSNPYSVYCFSYFTQICYTGRHSVALSSSISKEIYALSSDSLERSSEILAQPFDDCCLEKLCLWRLWAHNPWKVAARAPSGSPNPYLQSVPRAPADVINAN